VEAGDEEYVVDLPLLLTIVGFAKSQSEARRLITQNAVEIDGKTVTERRCLIHPSGSKIRVGKRRFVELVESKRR
jgi:tyrosyl-tRNA synthetase